MNVFDIIGGIILLIACIILIVLVMLQESKDNGVQSLTGGSSDSYLGKNSGRTLAAMLSTGAVSIRRSAVRRRDRGSPFS